MTLLGLGLALFSLSELGVGRRLHEWRSARADSAPRAPELASARPAFQRPAELKVVEWIFDGGRKPEWQDWGWAKRADVPGGAARVQMSDWGGWRLVRPGLAGTFGGLTFRFKAPRGHGQFLTVQLAHPSQHEFPRILIEKAYTKPLASGALEVFVPMQHLNPDGQPFEQVVFAPVTSVPEGFVEIDRIGFTEALDPKTLPPPAVKKAEMSVTCGGPKKPVSPLIYGIGMAHDVAKQEYYWSMSPAIRRWGGNPASRYNWRLGNAWNTASDWFFENVDYAGTPGYSYRTFIENNRRRGVKTALTVPMIGWVAKDTSSVSFPRSTYPVQDAFDGGRPEAGNGLRDGKPLRPPPQTTTSVPAPPSFIKEWIETIVREDEQRGVRSVHQYILDNEPMLWNTTHRDVHPEPATYDELLEKTIAYGTAIREADPKAVIAGPAEWGWMGYLYSAKDVQEGALKNLDRLAHGNVPLVEWYLRKLAEHEKRSGVRILDVLDLHFYPQGLDKDAGDEKSAQKRLRSTRAFWDSKYKDESWINEVVRLLPRMKEWIAKNYPGLGISIGEWNFGGEKHISGGLATAETLGRFAENGVTSAFYWSIPPENSPTVWGFRAFRNFDGRGAAFEEFLIPARAADGTSLFASRDESGRRFVLVALNLDPKLARSAEISLRGCEPFTKTRAYSYSGGPAGLTPHRIETTPGALNVELAPYSITVVEGRVEPIASD
jgi:hypothetical protein